MKTEKRSTAVCQKRLLAELQLYQDRVDRARRELPVDAEPEDDAGIASRSTYREGTMGKVERDLRTIDEIQRALKRLDEGQYFNCIACHVRIPEARRKAIPWARTCVECAGGGNRMAGPFQLKPRLAH